MHIFYYHADQVYDSYSVWCLTPSLNRRRAGSLPPVRRPINKTRGPSNLCQLRQSGAETVASGRGWTSSIGNGLCVTASNATVVRVLLSGYAFSKASICTQMPQYAAETVTVQNTGWAPRRRRCCDYARMWEYGVMSHTTYVKTRHPLGASCLAAEVNLMYGTTARYLQVGLPEEQHCPCKEVVLCFEYDSQPTHLCN